MILNIPINCQWRATYILKTELSPACYDKETDAGQSDTLLLLKTAATTVICIMLAMPRCSFLLKLAKFGQERIDAAPLEQTVTHSQNQRAPQSPEIHSFKQYINMVFHQL